MAEVSLTAVQPLKGKISKLDTLHGKSAFEVAVINGFSGTEAEWLASLKGEKGTKGEHGESGVYLGSGEMPEECNVQIDPNGQALTIADIVEAVRRELNAPAAKIGYVELPASGWVGETSPYSQVVTLEGVTERSQVDLTPNAEQLAIFSEKDLTFVTENDGGVVTVYAIGQKPQNDYRIQVTITETERVGADV